MLLHLIHQLVTSINHHHHHLHVHHHLITFPEGWTTKHCPFPTDGADTDTESNADPRGAFSNEKPDNQVSANIIHGEEPKTHAQAMASPDAAEWLEVEHYELDQLAQLDVYDLILLPPGHSHTGCRWVYKIKCDTEGNIILYRACIVAQGFTQCPGEDFLETFAPVAKIESIRLSFHACLLIILNFHLLFGTIFFFHH